MIAEYEGDRLPSGVITGHGRAVFTNGHAYQGEWVSGQMHGQGALYFQDGIAYEGDFVENSISGYGVRKEKYFRVCRIGIACEIPPLVTGLSMAWGYIRRRS